MLCISAFVREFDHVLVFAKLTQHRASCSGTYACTYLIYTYRYVGCSTYVLDSKSVCRCCEGSPVPLF
jgi:hypothetical protein